MGMSIKWGVTLKFYILNISQILLNIQNGWWNGFFFLIMFLVFVKHWKCFFFNGIKKILLLILKGQGNILR